MVFLELMLLFVFGLALGKIFEKIKIPKILGYLVVGIILGNSGLNIVDHALEYMKIFTTIAITIIIFKAGMGIDKKTLKKVGIHATFSGIIPCILEGLTLTIFAVYVFNMDWLIAAMLAFIVTPASPAVIVPLMLKLKDSGFGEEKGISTFGLTATAIDNVVTITIFYTFYHLFISAGSTSIGVELLWVLFGIVTGIIMGIILGKLLEIFLNKTHKTWTDNFMNICLYILILMALLTFKIYLEQIHIVDLFVILIIGYIFGNNVNPKVVEKVKKTNHFIWSIVEIFLFTMVGAIVEFNYILNIEGYSTFVGIFLSLAFILAGLGARYLGIFISTIKSSLNSKEKIFISMSLTAKGTVQASLAFLPLSAMISLGWTGAQLTPGYLIIGLAVFAILITIPLGTFSTDFLEIRLLDKKQEEDKKIKTN